jgi:cellulose synthase/poly-beta-1,6-N-acetylglucosamine synthase-like glycosyltransferase
MKTVSIGVFAYNEERNCAQIMEALLTQECRETRIIEILFISSASTDKTDAIVRSFAERNPIVRLIREPVRRGKSAAINAYLKAKNPNTDVCMIASADILPDRQAVENMALALSDPQYGMAGGRPMPVNKAENFLGFVVHLQWKLHHIISLHNPKCGEMIALRSDLARSIPIESSVDEASLEAITVRKGLKLRYVPEAIFINRGPETMRDFLSQRRRIASGHRWLKRTKGYMVSTASSWTILKALCSQPPHYLREWVWTAGAIGLEAVCRVLGTMDFYLRPRVHQVWRIAKTTKQSFLAEELAGIMNERELKRT